MKNNKGMTLIELVLTICISTVALAVTIATIISLVNSYSINTDRLSDNLSMREANSHLHKYIREASYAEVQDLHGAPVDTGQKLVLYDYHDSTMGVYEMSSEGLDELEWTDLRDPDNIDTEVFEGIALDFSNINEIGGKVTEVRINYSAPFASVAYVSTRPLVVKGNTWALFLNSGNHDEALHVQQTSDGGYIMGGDIAGGVNTGVSVSCYLIKVDKTGNHQWSKTFNNATSPLGGSTAYYAEQTSDGGYVLAGLGNDSNFFLVKTDANGNNEWSRSIGAAPPAPFTISHETAASVKETGDGGFVVAGVAELFGPLIPEQYGYVVKLDSGGNNEWSRYIGTRDRTIIAYAQETRDGGYMAVGYTHDMELLPNGSRRGANIDGLLVKLDADGNNEWSRTFGGGHTLFWRGQQTSDEGYILLGYTYDFGAGFTDVYLVKTDSGGRYEWSKTFGGRDMESGSNVQETQDGGYIVVGSTRSFGAGTSDVYLLKTDRLGNLEWSNTFGTASFDEGLSVQEVLNSDGNAVGYIVTGYGWSSASRNDDVFLIRTDMNGNCVQAENPTVINTYSPSSGTPTKNINTLSPPTGAPTEVIDTSGIPGAPPNPPTGTPTTRIDTSGIPSAPPNPPTGTPTVHDPGEPL